MPTTVTSLRNCRYLLAWILISLVALLFITGFLFTSSSLSLVDLELAGESSSALMGSSPLPGDQDYNELALLQSMVTMMRRKTVEAVQSSNSKDENAIINGVIMPKMGNTTVREELGRATWRLLHTMASRLPTKPTDVQRLSFELFVYLLSRLYPCGNCASHFQLLLSAKQPAFPSRDSAIQWMCETHNIVNKRLSKPVFNCADAEELWKCGCPADGDTDDAMK